MRQISKSSERSITRGNLNLERYLKDIKKYEAMSKVDELAIIHLAQSGDQAARDKLVLANVRFVVSCAKEYQAPSIEINDLIMAGNIGLITAINKFDPNSGYKFYSYAVWWIKQAVVEFLKDNSRSIRLPYNQQEEINRLFKEKDKLEVEWEANMNIADVLDNEDSRKDANLIKSAIECYNYAFSLDSASSLNEGEETTLGETLASNEDTFGHFETEHRTLYLRKAMEKLNTMQQKVLEYAFGLNEDKVFYTNDDIATMLHVTSERIRQIKLKALAKLREDKNLRKYL